MFRDVIAPNNGTRHVKPGLADRTFNHRTISKWLHAVASNQIKRIIFCNEKEFDVTRIVKT